MTDQLVKFDRQFEKNRIEKRMRVQHSCNQIFKILDKLHDELDSYLDGMIVDAVDEVEEKVEYLKEFAR